MSMIRHLVDSLAVMDPSGATFKIIQPPTG